MLSLLGLLCLLHGIWAAPGDLHSLCYDFTVIFKPVIQQWSCEVQGKVDEKSFLYYNCDIKEVKPSGLLGKEIQRTNTWEEQNEMLMDVIDVFKQQLPEVEPKNYTIRGPLTLQGRMSCQCEANGLSNGSWRFSFNGQIFLLFDSKKRKWTVVHSGARLMEKTWVNDRDVTEFFRKISVGDCRRWLENFLVHWDKMLETTGPPTVVPNAFHAKATTIGPRLWTLLVILTISVLLGT
ncbi:NKG2D ligand 1 [Tupaia chinensis]|uniref:NKG2D ligand 1 n=2 Tax=Tupaia chinensis TaxID=246437 RepID=L9LCX3_TUPCH|nr:NKG2D ligand 1 [Tupaia chinensis]